MATYDIGDGGMRVSERRRVFSDGQYHYVTFRRHDKKAYLRVDDYDILESLPDEGKCECFFICSCSRLQCALVCMFM